MTLRAIASLTLCLIPGLVACSDDSSDDTETDAKTLVAIDSADFPSSAACAMPSDDSAPRNAYVAELLDVSGVVAEDGLVELDDFVVQSSAPVACGTSIGFSLVEPDRTYEIIARIYPDLDQDPDTLDICTVEGTSVTVTRVDGKCTTELASPSSTLHCYGWQAPTDEDASSLEIPDGEPVLAIEYRTIYAHYCIESEE